MLSAIRSRITYVNVVATLVLVFAMTGGAYAAKKYLITSTKQISPSVLKSLKGANGANGAAGAAGAQGPQGPAGPGGPAGSVGGQGAKGETGAAGKEGPQGKDGATGAKGANGTPGLAGATGPEGSPWTAGGTLPSGKTETGVWSFSGDYEAFKPINMAVSFPIPLATALDQGHVREVTFETDKELVPKFSGESFTGFEEVTPVQCLGSVDSPTALSGYLCVYLGQLSGISAISPGAAIYLPNGEADWGADTTGASLSFLDGAEEAHGAGTFAVTAP